MDFEIEDSEEDESYDHSFRKQQNHQQQQAHRQQYNYGNSNSYQKNSQQQQPVKKKPGFDDDEDDDMYNFDYDGEANQPVKGGRIQPFSPAFHGGGSNARPNNTFSDDSYANQANAGNNNAHLRVSTQSNESALERAKNLMDKYSNKNYSAPKSNFKAGRAKYFDEDDISIDDEDEEEQSNNKGNPNNFSADIEMSESNDVSPEKVTYKPTTTYNKPPVPQQSSQVSNVKSFPEKTLTRANNRPSGFNESAVYSDFNESIPEESRNFEESAIHTERDDEDDEKDNEEEEYNDDDFDEVDEDNDQHELDESVEELEADERQVKISSQAQSGKTQLSSAAAVSGLQRVKSEDDDYNDDEDDNGSYSRIVYDKNDGSLSEEDEDEDEEDEFKVSKSKILSFADLAEYAGWENNKEKVKEEPTVKNNPPIPAVVSAPPIPVVVATKKEAPAPVVPSKTEIIPPTVPLNMYEYQPEHTIQRADTVLNAVPREISSKPIASSVPVTAPAPAPASAPAPQHRAPEPISQFQPPSFYPPQNSTVPASYVPPRPAVTIQEQPQHQYPHNPHEHHSHPPATSGYPPHHHHQSAPFAPPNHPPPNTAQQSPYPQQTWPPAQPQQPYGYPNYYPPYPYPPPATPGYYPPPPSPYGYPYPPYYPPYPYAYPPYPPQHQQQHSPPNPQNPYYPPGYPPNPIPSPYGNNGTAHEILQNKPVVFELIQELNAAQAEANWAKSKLAETIVLLRKSKDVEFGTQRTDVFASMTSAGILKKSSESKEKGDNDEEDEYEDEYGDENNSSMDYSEDFETSQLNTSSASHHNKRFSPKKNSKSTSWKSLPKLSEEPVLPNNHNNNNPASSQVMNQLINDEIMEILKRESRASYRPPELTTVDPFTDSIAKSFLASQELLRAKLESLKLRMQMSTQANRFSEFQTDVQESTSKTLQPSLNDIKADFETRRSRNQQKVLSILKQKYPDLDENELLDVLKLTDP